MFLTKAVIAVFLSTLLSGRIAGQLNAGTKKVEPEYLLAPGENINKKIQRNLFLSVQAEKHRCYVGEPILVTYKLYSRLVSTSRILKHPALSGCSVYDMITPISAVRSIERIGGRPFQVYTLKKAQIIPLQTGTISLDPMEVMNQVRFIKSTPQQEANSNLGELLDRFEKEEKAPVVDLSYMLKSRNVRIEVAPLPEGAPKGFQGLVGNYQIAAAIRTPDITMKDPVELEVVIRGHGNISLIDAPDVFWPADIDTLDIQTSEKIDATAVPLKGTKTFIYRFIPRKSGQYRIPAVSFAFFDPDARSYKSVASAEIVFHAAVTNSAVARSAAVSKKPSPESKAIFNIAQIAWIAAVIILLAAGTWLWRNNAKLRAQHRQDQLLIESLQKAASDSQADAGGVTGDPLEDARALLSGDDLQSFWRELNKVLWKMLATTTKLPPSQLNKETIAVTLKKMGFDEELSLRVEHALRTCESNLYSPEQSQPDAMALMKDAEVIVAGLHAGNRNG